MYLSKMKHICFHSLTTVPFKVEFPFVLHHQSRFSLQAGRVDRERSVVAAVRLVGRSAGGPGPAKFRNVSISRRVNFSGIGYQRKDVNCVGVVTSSTRVAGRQPTCRNERNERPVSSELLASRRSADVKHEATPVHTVRDY